MDYWDNIADMKISGDYLYAANRSAGLRIMDISDQQAPVQAAHLYQTGYVQHFVIDDTLCYVLDGGGASNEDSGFTILNISDPTSPEILSKTELGGMLYGLAVIDTVLYISSTINIHIYNVNDPQNPIYITDYTHWGFNIGSLYCCGNALYAAEYGIHDNMWFNIFSAVAPYDIELIGGFPNSSNCGSMHFDNDLAVLNAGGTGFRICRMTDPFMPEMISEINTPGDCSDSYIHGDYLYAADGENGGLRIYDIADPAEPVLIGTNLLPDDAFQTAAFEQSIYLADYNTGLSVFDGSDPQNPAYLNTFGNFADMAKLVVDSNYAFVVDGYYGMRVFDLTDHTNPGEIAVWGPGIYQDKVECIVKADNLVYLGMRDYGLVILDVSDPANPTETGSCEGFEITWDLALGNGFIYGVASGGVNFIDVSDPTNPQYIHTYNPPGQSLDVAFKNNYLYIANSSNLTILDVSDPVNPVEISVLDISHSKRIDVKDNLLVNYDTYLSIIDIINPEEPVILNSLYVGGTTSDVEICGNYVICATWYDGFHVVDITDPTEPVIIGFDESAGDTQGLYVTDNYIYLSDKWNFGIYEYEQFSSLPGLKPEIPNRITLNTPYPNPFNNRSVVSFSLERAGEVSLKVFDITGREVASLVNGHLSLGYHEVVWNAEGMASGVYFVRLGLPSAGTLQLEIRKVILLK